MVRAGQGGLGTSHGPGQPGGCEIPGAVCGAAVWWVKAPCEWGTPRGAGPAEHLHTAEQALRGVDTGSCVPPVCVGPRAFSPPSQGLQAACSHRRLSPPSRLPAPLGYTVWARLPQTPWVPWSLPELRGEPAQSREWGVPVGPYCRPLLRKGSAPRWEHGWERFTAVWSDGRGSRRSHSALGTSSSVCNGGNSSQAGGDGGAGTVWGGAGAGREKGDSSFCGDWGCTGSGRG